MINATTIRGADIRALDQDELDAVNGGFGPLVIIAAAAGGAAAGTAAAVGIWKLAKWITS